MLFSLFLLTNFVSVRMQKETRNGKQEDPMAFLVASNFSEVEGLSNYCLDNVKMEAFTIIQKTILMMIKMQRQHTMKMKHYPQSRYNYDYFF